MKELPLTVRRSIELIGLFVLGWLLALGNNTLAPLLMAFFIALVLLPLHHFFVRWRVPNTLAIALCILFLFSILGLVVWFFYDQVGALVADLPAIRANVTAHLTDLSAWVMKRTSYSTAQQLKFINEQSDKLLTYTGLVLNGTIGSVTSMVVFITLVPLYIFLLMLYRGLLRQFVYLWFPSHTHNRVAKALAEIRYIVKDYIVGLFIQISYMTVLVGGGLMLFGIKHALLIGLLFAFLNLIPYVGALLGNLLGVLITLASSSDLGPILTVLLVIAGAQFLDNNILMPRIVGSKVQINPLATIVGVIVGGLIAGIMGMFLALPILAVLRIIFDHSDHLKPWGVLIGEEED